MHWVLDEMVVIIELSRPEQTCWIIKLVIHFAVFILKWVVPHQYHCVFQESDSFFQKDVRESITSNIKKLEFHNSFLDLLF